MLEFKLPDLGEGIAEGEILAWHVELGDDVAQDAPLVDVETDKAAVTIPAPKAGRLIDRFGDPGDIIAVGQVLAVLDLGAADKPAPAATPQPHPPVASAAVATVLAVNPAPVKRLRRPVPAAPATRRLARELGVDINLAQASGPGGRILTDDVQRLACGGGDAKAGPEPSRRAMTATAAAEANPVLQPEPDVVATQNAPALPSAPGPGSSGIPFVEIEPLPDFAQWGPVQREPLRSIRRKVARRMATAMVVVPHVAHMDEADVTELEAFRQRENTRRGGDDRLTLLPFVIKAVTAGLRAARSFNASLDPFAEEIVYKEYINLGVAVDSGKGLIVPVVKDTEKKSIRQLSREIADLAAAARNATIQVDQLRGGTFTVTNIGAIGGTGMVPTINYPEVAILGMGRVQEKPVVRDGEIVVRKILPLTLGFDHRVADGADAARFVADLVEKLSDPSLLFLET